MKSREHDIYKRLDKQYTELRKESQSEANGFLLFAYLIIRKYVDIPMHVTTFYDSERHCEMFIAEFKD